MGYGASVESPLQHLGRSGDEGLDGSIAQDRLGLDVVFVQAKRWATDRTVGRPDIQAFVGALHGARATKGVFITTARFSREAADYASSVGNVRIVLVDGRQLSQLMIQHGVGVTADRSYTVNRVDEDFFAEELGAATG
jgi:restriction system protein